MNKAELVSATAEKAKITKKDAAKIIDAFVESVEDGLVNDGKVIISKFVSFEVKQMEARTGRNPKTGDVVSIPEKKKVACKFSSLLKEKINN